MKFKMIIQESSDADGTLFSQHIKEHLDNGWTFHGSTFPAASDNRLHQALTKPELRDEKIPVQHRNNPSLKGILVVEYKHNDPNTSFEALARESGLHIPGPEFDYPEALFPDGKPEVSVERGMENTWFGVRWEGDDFDSYHHSSVLEVYLGMAGRRI